jgi:peptidoglycan glycosyltransferase
MTYPTVSQIDLPDTGNPPQILHNYDFATCGGNLEQLVVRSCDSDFATIGQQLGADALVTQAEQYGFNQRVPLDVPQSTVAASNFGTVASFATDLPGLMKSAIGQDNVAASALQMAMVAGTVADGGVEMTPHVMGNIRDSQGDLVKTYSPTQWMRPISAQTAATLTTYMQGVVSDPLGTAAQLGLPASWHVAAKTGTAEVGVNLQNTTDWFIAFAPNGNSKVAVAVVVPNQAGKETGAGIAGPIVKQILQNVLGK